jgi:hypothetical protein
MEAATSSPQGTFVVPLRVGRVVIDGANNAWMEFFFYLTP